MVSILNTVKTEFSSKFIAMYPSLSDKPFPRGVSFDVVCNYAEYNGVRLSHNRIFTRFGLD